MLSSSTFDSNQCVLVLSVVVAIVGIVFTLVANKLVISTNCARALIKLSFIYD